MSFFISEDKDLPFLFRALHSLAADASCFFLQLGVQNFNQVKSDSTSVDDAFVLGLQKWLNGTCVSRRGLVEAVFKPAGGNNRRLARELANLFKGIHNSLNITHFGYFTVDYYIL